MKNIKPYYIILILIISGSINSCVEPFEIETQNFESIIVIEASITNELKKQEVNLTRTFRFEEDGPSAESNATVSIVDNLQNTFNFEETDPGKYVSAMEFRAVPNVTYELMITTNDGKEYLSAQTELTATTQIDRLYAQREVNDRGIDGISINVDSSDPLENSKFYRYEYVETYKIIAPFWNSKDAVVVLPVNPRDPPILTFVQRMREERVCYVTTSSNTIIQTTSNNLTGDRIVQFPVRFIPADDFIISHRYSIFVKQFVQSFEAFSYFKTLNELSTSESLFSENQPGFFNGNIFSVSNTDEKVLGFFEVSSVFSQRMFFNFRDFYNLDVPLPPYIVPCPISAPEMVSDNGSFSLFNAIEANLVKFYNLNFNPVNGLLGPALMVPPPCSDCTKIGTNIVPDFWIE